MTFLDGLKLVSEGLDDKSKQEYSFEKPQTTVSDNNGDDSNPFLNVRYVYMSLLLSVSFL